MRYVKAGCLGLIAMGVLMAALAAWLWFYDAGLNRDFDPAVVAGSETRMWQAYYAQDKETLGLELITLMREQFGLSYGSAYEMTKVLAGATMTFSSSRDNYEQQVLPGLTKFYTQVKEYAGGDWDPEAAAKAELAWWVARRTEGQNSPENVGALIANLYAVLYGETNAHIERAGLLRAQAAAFRDAHRPNPDWTRVEEMLLESYDELKAGVLR